MTKEALVGAMRQRVLDRLSACLPGLAQVDAVRLVAAANADKRRGLRELDAFLQAFRADLPDGVDVVGLRGLAKPGLSVIAAARRPALP